MKELLVLIAVVCYATVSGAQTLTDSQRQMLIKRHKEEQIDLKAVIDKHCIAIDLGSYSRIDIDTVIVHDITNPNRILGFVVDKTYWVTNNKLVKASLSDYRGEESTFYFTDSLLIKVVCVNLNTKESKQYYYTENDNETSPLLIYRIRETIPELSDFYNKLSVGRFYLKK